MVSQALRHARRLIILVVGGTLVLVGLALIFLPGPAIVVIPAGLTILGTEFAWARRLLKKVRQKSAELYRSAVSCCQSDAGSK